MTEPDLLHAALETFNVALGRLEAALDQPPTEWTRDAAIQRFEFGGTYSTYHPPTVVNSSCGGGCYGCGGAAYAANGVSYRAVPAP
jgi:hypothetical protein